MRALALKQKLYDICLGKRSLRLTLPVMHNVSYRVLRGYYQNKFIFLTYLVINSKSLCAPVSLTEAYAMIDKLYGYQHLKYKSHSL